MNNDSIINENNILRTFNNPAEEIAFLRSKIAERKSAVANMPIKVTDLEHADSVIREYSAKPIDNLNINNNEAVDSSKLIEQVDSFLKSDHDKYIEDMLERLGHKDTDAQVKDLVGAMMQNGIRTTIDAVEKMKKPELEDDFHRFLISYLLSGHEDEIKSLNKRDYKSLHMKLYQIILPQNEGGSNKKNAKEFASLMQQLFSGLQSVASDDYNKDNNYYTVELAISNDSNDIVFYTAVPHHMSVTFEKMLLGYFPDARVEPCDRDYNIFHDDGYQVASIAKPHDLAALPLRTYEELEGDSISIIMSSLTKLKKSGEGAAMQILIKPAGDTYLKKYASMLDEMRDGDSLKDIEEKQGFFGSLMYSTKKALDTSDHEGKKEDSKKFRDDEAVKNIQKKISATIVDTNIRLLASAETLERAKFILQDLESTFSQYAMTYANSVVFEKVEPGRFNNIFHDFTYRIWNDDQSYPLNLKELASIYHYPADLDDFAQLKVSKATVAPAPLDLPQDGILLGVNKYRGVETEIHLQKEMRLRHTYVIGQTGTGKTVTLKNMIIQDIKNGDGCCFIDPHGSDVQDILANIPPERYQDVIYFDPSHTERPMALNMMEYDVNKPEQRIFVVNEMLGIFNKLFDMSQSGGPGFESYFRNTALLVMEHPESGNTMLEILQVLSNKDFRDYKLSKCKNPLIKQFWANAEKTTGETGLQNWVPYISNKFDVFLANDVMRPVIVQEKSSFNFREIMDNKKIFLVNLSKGILGEMNSKLIGLILVGKFQMAALSRADSYGTDFPHFYLYLDEFQNITTPAISSILSEARKYKLSLNLAHQFIAQLPDDIKGAVFGNVGNKFIHRVGPDDAKFLEQEFAPVFTAADIMKIDNFNCYVKMMADNMPQKPFNMLDQNAPKGNKDQVQMLKDMSYNRYGRPRAEIEDEIARKWENQ